MASVSDTLTTVLKLTGTQQMVAGLGSVAVATEGVAAAQSATAAATAGLGANLLAFAGGPVGVALVAIGALIGVLGKSVTAWGQSDLAVTRIAAQMKNLGNVFPTKDLLDFAGALSHTTGIDDELIATLGATAAQFGLTEAQIKKLLPTVLDIAQIKGLNPGEVLQSLLRASRGQTRGLLALGIDPSKVQGDIKNIDNLISQVGKGFQGGAAAVRNTLPGALEALKTASENLFESIGRLFGPALIKIINVAITVIEKLTDLINWIANLAERFHIIRPRENGGLGDASGLALKGDPEQTKYLRDIANNTDKQADALVREVLGGAGTVAAGATNWRDLNLSMGV